MNQIKHFFRYEIPGYLFFLYVFIIVVSTLKKSIIVAYIIPNIVSIATAGFLIAIPIGWIIYQIYVPYRFKGFKGLNCHPKTLEKVKKWFPNYLEKKFINKLEEEKTKDIYYQQAIDIGIYSNNYNLSDHFDLLINNLSNKYNSYDTRFIVGLWVPIFSIAFLIIYYLFSYFCNFNFYCLNLCRFWFIGGFLVIVGVISICIYFHKKTIKKAIKVQEEFLISIKKKKIEKALKTLLDEDSAKN